VKHYTVRLLVCCFYSLILAWFRAIAGRKFNGFRDRSTGVAYYHRNR